MVAICPCCHQSVPNSRLLVSTDVGQVSRGDAQAHVSPHEAKLIYELNAAYPGAAKRDDLIWALYGYSDEPSDPSRVIMVALSRLRKKLAPLGVTIHAVPGLGYRIELTDAL